MPKSKHRQRLSDIEYKGGIYQDDYDTEYGLSFEKEIPDGPLHGEPSANVAIGSPRMPNRSTRTIAKGRTKGFIGG